MGCCGQEIEDGVVDECEALAAVGGGAIELCATAAEAVAGADIVYTDSWQSYGITQTEERGSRHKGAARWGLKSIRGVTGHSAGGERACAGGSGRSGAGLGSERSRPRGPSESGSHSGRPRPCPPSCPR